MKQKYKKDIEKMSEIELLQELLDPTTGLKEYRLNHLEIQIAQLTAIVVDLKNLLNKKSP